MKINESNRISAINSYHKHTGSRVENAKAHKKDEVQISAAAKEMLTTSQLNNAERKQHIESLKQSVASGTYHVEAGKIAEKLLPYMNNKSLD